MYWSPTRSRVERQRARLADVHRSLLGFEHRHGRAPATLDELVQADIAEEQNLRCTCGSRYFLDPRVRPDARQDSEFGRAFCLRCLIHDRVTVLLFGSGAVQEVRNGAMRHK